MQLTLQSAIDGILAELATLGGATNLMNAPAWQGEIAWDLLVGTNQIRNLHAVAPLSIALANDNWTLSLCDAYSKAEADALLLPYSTTAQMTQAIADALVPYGTAVQRDAAIAAALAAYYTSRRQTAPLLRRWPP